MPDSSDSSSFLHDSAGGLGLSPKAPGRGATCASRPLVLSEQHDREWHPAWARWERPPSGVPAGQAPPGADGLPAAGPGCRPAKASPQNASGALRHGTPVRRPQDRRQRAGSQQQDHWQRGPLSAGLETGLKWAIIVFYLILFL